MSAELKKPSAELEKVPELRDQLLENLLEICSTSCCKRIFLTKRTPNDGS